MKAQIKHTHPHRHRFNHPHAFGRSTWIGHEHEHRHSDPHGPETVHRPHTHTLAETAALRKARTRGEASA